MHKILSALALALLALLAGAAAAATTGIAQVPLLNISGTGTVKPNLMLLYDNSGSMASTFTPDYVDDSTSCRARATMAGATRGCKVGDPPFNSADFNRQYYDPKVSYSPPVKADGSSYPSLDRAATSGWAVVPTDGYGVNNTSMLGGSASSTNLVSGFPDLRWCDAGGACGYNSATYTYPSDTRYYAQNFSANPYYYSIGVAEYCTDAGMATCRSTAVGAAAPPGYPVPARVRWCNSTALTNCQAKYVGAYKYPRFSDPLRSPDWFGTVAVLPSSTTNSMTISSVSVIEPGGPVAITNLAVTAATGTNTAAKQASTANALAAAIIAKGGLANPYTACVRTPSGGVAACSSFGVTLDSDNVVAVLPLGCPVGYSGKSVGPCTLLTDGSRAGYGLAVASGTAATALLTVSGTSNGSKTEVLSGVSLGGTQLFSGSLSLARNASAAQVALAIASHIGTVGTVRAMVGGSPGSPALCAGAGSATVCLVDSDPGADGANVALGSLSNNGGGGGTHLRFGTAAAVADGVPTATTTMGAPVFVRTDIVPARTSYPKGPGRSDCAGATCSYDEEMTNFANWYGYYKTRNQMMKTAVGQAFQPITDNYNVGLVSLSVAAAEGAMKVPRPFSGTDRGAWYDALYAMQGSQSTPMRQALHAVGKMYANQSPYVAAAGDEVVRFPCQQNFTFVTTDGYWNGGAAASVVNNDNVDNPARFCTGAKGCFDPSAQSANSLADVALYWYNGGSNTTTSSLRPTLEDLSRPGLVPAAAGENTRLHMNTYALGLGVDGVMNYERNYDTAPAVGGDFYKLVTGVTSGCPWNGGGAYLWPDPKTGDSSGSAAYQSRVDDLWHAAVNGHGKYFSASDPRQVVAGLSAALSNIQVKIGAAAAAATSTPNISQQDNDIFSDTFTTVKWYGQLSDKKIDTVTGIVGSTALWDSSDQVGRKVAGASDTRRIVMLDADAGGLKDFSYAAMNSLERSWFDNKCSALGQCASLTAADRATVNGGANIVGWLRGQQQYANDTLMRAYARTDHNPSGLSAPLPIVLGDIASSKPAYVREPRKAYTLPGYSQFRVDNAHRAATVFVAANDGMLHAFDAVSGEEIWAYAPRITMNKLYLLASTTYGTNHQFNTDGSPEVADVQVGGLWKTVLVAGLNGGGRGYYALDVTDPGNPVALWELCADAAVCSGAHNAPDLGLSFGNPQFGTWNDSDGTAHWVVFLTSGYNNVPGSDGVAGGSGKGFLFVVDVASGAVLAKVGTGAGDTATPSGLAKITAISASPLADPLVTYVYGGDNLGQMWRFDFTTPGTASVVKMGDAGPGQPVTTRPDVTQCRVETVDAGGVTTAAAKTVVVFGTGRLLDVPDVADTGLQSLYVLKDAPVGVTASQWRAAAYMAGQGLAKAAGGGADTYTISGPAVDLSSQLGWYVDFDQNSGERVNLDPKIVSGGVNVVTNMPTSSSACSVGGTSNVYQLNVCTARAVAAAGGGDAPAGSTLSNTSAAVGFIIVRLPSGALKMVTTTADGNTITSGVAPASSQGARKAGWRRVRN